MAMSGAMLAVPSPETVIALGCGGGGGACANETAGSTRLAISARLAAFAGTDGRRRKDMNFSVYDFKSAETL
jgi:hypothetical protein